MKDSASNYAAIWSNLIFFDWIRQWLSSIEIQNPRTAKFLCKSIPARCPFEREIGLFGRKVFRIPPLCKLNPLYPQIVALRLKSLTYLAEQQDEDVTLYC